MYYETLVKAVHDYLCEILVYNHDAADNKYNEEKTGYYQTAYSAFYGYEDGTERSTVCAGYAKAFKVLCDSYGITCILVSGTAGNSPESSVAVFHRNCGNRRDRNDCFPDSKESKIVPPSLLLVMV